MNEARNADDVQIRWSDTERRASNNAYWEFAEGRGLSHIESGEIWRAAWSAARDHYAPNADAANALAAKFGTGDAF